jgi:hypothetical protein
MANAKGEKRGEMYWLDGVPYLSVTQCLSVINKPALMQWFGREVYFAVAKEPSLSLEGALRAPYSMNASAKSRGSTVHDIIEAYEHTREFLTSVPPQFRPYAEAFYKWVSDNRVTVLEHEKTIKNAEHRFAGTLDMLVKMGDTPETMVVDAKTGKGLYAETGLQLSAYLHADGSTATAIAGLLLSPDGTYEFKRYRPDFPAFLAAKRLYEWSRYDQLVKLGYLK